MKEFILVKEALTDKLMIIRKSMICSVEETTKDSKSVRRICYIDGRTPEYVQDKLIDIFNTLENN